MSGDVEWRVAPGLTDYAEAVAAMEARAAAIHRGDARELIWLVEHPPLYTAGTSARVDDLLDARLPIIVSGRGGRYTYHGPGQRVVYVLLDLNARGRDVRCFVAALERWLVAALARLGVTAATIPGRIGVWVDPGGTPAKIAAIGVRVRRWITLHGAAINVAPDLSHFTGIVPCGIADAAVTSLAELGSSATLDDIDASLTASCETLFAAIPRRQSIPLEQAGQLG